MKASTFIGTLLMALAVGIFYLCFFIIAPLVASTIPEGVWHLFLSCIVYGVIAYFGGIGIPLGMMIAGIIILLKRW